MTAAVRMFAYAGVTPLNRVSDQQAVNNTEFVYREPYLANQTITINTGGSQTSSVNLSPQGSRVLRIEVQKGHVVHYEVTLQGNAPKVATTDSPTLEGHDHVDWGVGYTISLLEAGSEA